MIDGSFKPDPERKGTYRRRIEDIARGLTALELAQLPPQAQFLALFFGCEKLARGLVGIHALIPADEAYHHRTKIRLAEIQRAASALTLPVTTNEIAWIFAHEKDAQALAALGGALSARQLRNRAAHEFGPSNVLALKKQADIYLPKMHAFLNCAPQVVEHLDQNFSHIA